jgi:hypothetical protein
MQSRITVFLVMTALAVLPGCGASSEALTVGDDDGTSEDALRRSSEATEAKRVFLEWDANNSSHRFQSLRPSETAELAQNIFEADTAFDGSGNYYRYRVQVPNSAKRSIIAVDGVDEDNDRTVFLFDEDTARKLATGHQAHDAATLKF